MPTYIYRCDQCQQTVEGVVPVHLRDITNICSCGGTLKRDLGLQLRTVQVREVKGTENGPYARKLIDRMEENRHHKREFAEGQKRLLS